VFDCAVEVAQLVIVTKLRIGVFGDVSVCMLELGPLGCQQQCPQCKHFDTYQTILGHGCLTLSDQRERCGGVYACIESPGDDTANPIPTGPNRGPIKDRRLPLPAVRTTTDGLDHHHPAQEQTILDHSSPSSDSSPRPDYDPE
jgi:hypothetical protein